MPRAVWRGTLTFGLVSIPVSLYPATESKDVRFHLFDRTGQRVRYRRVVEGIPAEPPRARTGAEAGDNVIEPAGAEVDDEAATELSRGDRGGGGEREVAYEDLVRGYEVEPDRFVLLDAEEIARARPSPSRAIDLEDFVRLEDIDPVFFEKSYHVAPAEGAERPYVLLLRALEETRRIGIGRFVLRTKPHLVALRPMTGSLALETLYFADEVRDASALVRRAADVTVGRKEVEVAEKLVETLAAAWEPSRYDDEYREELLRMIAERAPETVERAIPAEPATARVGELMDALRRSVEEAKAARDRKGGQRAG